MEIHGALGSWQQHSTGREGAGANLAQQMMDPTLIYASLKERNFCQYNQSRQQK